MKYIASCSFGKDSLAQIIIAKYYNEPIDEVMYCEVMFTDKISGEFPEHRDFIYNVAIPKLTSVLGLRVVVLRSKQTMWNDFHTPRVRGESTGMLRGFPIPGLCNINRDCKLAPIRQYLKDQTEDYTQYIGIAADEPKRLARLGDGKVSLLAKYGITENLAYVICETAGLLSPIYGFTNRNGCFFCPNASVNELRHLYNNHPKLWLLLKELQDTPNTSRTYFTKSKTVYYFEDKFKEEKRKEKHDDSIRT